MKFAILALFFVGCAAPHWERPRYVPQFHRELSIELKDNGDARPQIVATFKITN